MYKWRRGRAFGYGSEELDSGGPACHSDVGRLLVQFEVAHQNKPRRSSYKGQPAFPAIVLFWRDPEDMMAA